MNHLLGVANINAKNSGQILLIFFINLMNV